MKKYFLFILTILMAACGTKHTTVEESDDNSIIAATHNLRYANASDSADGNGWGKRYPYVAKNVKDNNFEIFGTQEGLYYQLEDLKGQLPGFEYIGVGRTDGDKAGEFAALFYKPERFELLDNGNFWLSENTEKPNKGWDAALPRICTWGMFKDKKSGKEFYFFNLHMDHIGTVARAESAKLVVKKIKELPAGSTAIVTGDFNVDQNSEPYVTLNNSGVLKDSYTVAKSVNNPKGHTFNGYKLDKVSDSRIDHLFVTPNVEVGDYKVITNSYIDSDSVERYPSDHFPVTIVIENM